MASLDRMGLYREGDETGTRVELLGDSEVGPAEGAELAEQQNELRQAIGDLPEQARQVVRLVYFQGLKYREAADVLLIPVGTVKSRLHAAMQKLTETLTHVSLPQ